MHCLCFPTILALFELLNRYIVFFCNSNSSWDIEENGNFKSILFNELWYFPHLLHKYKSACFKVQSSSPSLSFSSLDLFHLFFQDLFKCHISIFDMPAFSSALSLLIFILKFNSNKNNYHLQQSRNQRRGPPFS
jgi:hypothetical protein